MTGCGSCVISLVPGTGKLSLVFVAQVSGLTAFGLDWQAGRNPNGAASSGTDPFTETGSYEFSNFSISPDPNVPRPVITETTETPLPGALPMLAGGLGVLGLLGWRRKRKVAAAA